MARQPFLKAIALFLIFVTASASLAAAPDPAISASHSSSHGSDFKLQDVLEHHLMDSPIVEWNIGGKKIYNNDPGFHKKTRFIRDYYFHDEKGIYRWEGGVPMHITRRVAMMMIVSLLLVLVFVSAAIIIRKNPLRVQGRFASFIETLVQYVRVEIGEANMGHHAKSYHSYLLTLFFFILFANLLGLFPPVGELMQIGGEGLHLVAAPAEHQIPFLVALWPAITVTGDIAVTGTLAIFTTLMLWVTGFRYQGYRFLWHVVPAGIHPILYILLWPMEFVIGPVAKGFALTIRLLANMTGGHIVILVLIGFIFQFKSLFYFIVPISLAGASAIYILEIFVAFLQAFIFTLLSAIFMGQVMHRH